MANDTRVAEKKPKVALVLSGGGATGAYEVGILKALFSGKSPTTGYKPLEPDIVCGTSIGSFNAAFLVSQWDRFGAASITNLERAWLENLAGSWRTNGVFRFYGNPFELLDPQHLLADPIEHMWRSLREVGALSLGAARRGAYAVGTARGSLGQRLFEAVNLSGLISTEPMERVLGKIDYQAIRRSSRWLKIAATNWITGQLRIFWNHDMTDRFGPLAVRASSSLPGFFPPVLWGAQPFADGSVLLNTPLSPAIHAGADVLHVIYLDPDIAKIPFPTMQNTYDTMMRMMQIKWAATYNDDIGDAARINRGVAAVEEMERTMPAGGSESFRQAVRDLTGTMKGMRPLTIYRYHPDEPVGGQMSFLDFERAPVEAMIERGFKDAVYHDFEESRDVFPAGVVPPPNPRRVL